MVYLPGSRRAAGNAKRPCASVMTLIAMVEPSFLAVTTTPSMLPSSAEETCPVRAEAPCASAGLKPATSTTVAIAVADASNALLNVMGASVLGVWLYLGGSRPGFAPGFFLSCRGG